MNKQTFNFSLFLISQRFQQEQKSVEAMSAASGPTFSYVNKHGPPTMGRMSIDERYGRSWATHYSDSQTHLLSTGSGNSSGTSNFYGMVTTNQLPYLPSSNLASPTAIAGIGSPSGGRPAGLRHTCARNWPKWWTRCWQLVSQWSR